MFPRKIDRRQMERAMRQMGVKMQELDGVREVAIKLSDREIVIPDAQVTLTEIAGQKSYQVIGREIERRLAPEIAEEDIKLVMEQAGVDKETANKALLETNGDIAEAILKLKDKS
ncbi:MAG: nascent polypeptide-associated complex protein [Candidatus Hadarchaeaceae archaeon]